MNLKTASFLALVGTLLLTALLLWNFLFTLLNVLHGIVPPVALFSSIIYAFGSLTVAIFIFVFHRAQS